MLSVSSSVAAYLGVVRFELDSVQVDADSHADEIRAGATPRHDQVVGEPAPD